jgi:ketosteroid isomerase-like protein
MAIRLDDGTEFRMRAGDLFDIPPGHDAWVDGPEVCVAVDYSSDATRYARAATAAEALEPPENADMLLVRKGFAAFNTGDIDTLRSVIAPDAVQHVPGKSLISGTYRGIDNILGYYGKLAELTDGTLRAHLLEVHGDGQGHVVAIFQGVGTRNSVTRVDRQSLFFTIDKGQAVDIVELHADLPGSDAFFS